jgi:hypothetical protein
LSTKGSKRSGNKNKDEREELRRGLKRVLRLNWFDCVAKQTNPKGNLKGRQVKAFRNEVWQLTKKSKGESNLSYA